MDRPAHLVIGSDGTVGGALFRRILNSGQPVIGTTRRGSSLDEHHIYLDLADGADAWRCPRPVSVAILCAGITRVHACREDPAYSSSVNVKGISTVIANLVAAGAFVIFLSTNQVLDGSVPRQPASSPHAPATEYGRQKAELETRLAQHGDSISIVRFAKILGPQPSLIPAWVESLRSGKPIHPFSGMTMAPIPLSCAVTVLLIAAQLRLPGILQVTGQQDISYADAARYGANALGLDPQLIQPGTAADSGAATDPIPAYTSLNIDRIKATMGITPPDSRWTIETAFANPQILGDA